MGYKDHGLKDGTPRSSYSQFCDVGQLMSTHLFSSSVNQDLGRQPLLAVVETKGDRVNSLTAQSTAWTRGEVLVSSTAFEATSKMLFKH